MFAKTTAFVFNLALPLLLVRRLNQVEFGLYKQLFLIVATAVSILPLGFAMSAYYFLPRERDRQPETIFNIFLYNLVVGLLACGAFVFWPALLGMLFHQPPLASYGPLIGAVILLWIVSSALEIIPIANQEVRLASAVIICVQLTRTGIYLAAVLMFGSVRALVYAAIVQGVLQTAVLLWYLQSRFHKFWKRLDTGLLRSQLSYSLPLGLAGLLFTTETDLHNYFVSNRLGPAIFAIYAIGTLQLPLMTMLQEATNSMVIPRVSILQQANDTREIISLLARAMRKLAAVYFPTYALLMVLAPEFVSFLFTRNYLASVPVFRINLTMLLLGLLLQDSLFRAYVSERLFLVRMRFILCVILVAGLWFATTRVGLLGVISVVVAVNVTERFVTAARFCGILHYSHSDIRQLADVGKLGIAAAAASLASVAIKRLLPGAKSLVVLMACGVVFFAIYLAVILRLRVLRAQEKAVLRDKLVMLLPRVSRSSPASD
jgi:O-antigen/teichoic acid export membrane protein